MTTNTITDLTEEDAADLQFPKDRTTDSSKYVSVLSDKKSTRPEIDSQCGYCTYELSVPYILCANCNVLLCLQCFAKGVEFESHKNDHDYYVVNNNFILFENSDWTAKEELILLDSILNLGNWDTVSKQLPNSTVKEIKEHYDYYYSQKRGSALFPDVPMSDAALFPQPIIPYRFRLADVEEPPRFASNSMSFHSVAGYNAARSDFELEYDTNAEDLVSNLNFPPISQNDPHFDLLTDLQFALVRSYNRRLWERQRRKCVIRNHGLILVRKTMAWLHRFDKTVTRPVCERMLRFMQFYTGMQFDYVMEGLHRAGELKAQISRLCEFRKKGITTLEGARLYLKLKQNREDLNRDLRTFQSNSQFSWKVRNSMLSLPVTNKRKGIFTPLDIVGLPSYEKLLPKEQDLCRNVRLVPLTYLELKEILVAENKKMGYLKLQTARRLLKIDVNKTRKLYDFLVQEGYISKPKS